MTEIHYVNRVDQSPFQKLEGDKIAESETTQPDPEAKFIAGESAVNVALEPIVEQAAVDLGHIKSAESEELPDDNIGNVASTSGDFNPAKALLTQVLDEAIRNSDLEFKRQVISAFKHLGLDTRKHFGV